MDGHFRTWQFIYFLFSHPVDLFFIKDFPFLLIRIEDWRFSLICHWSYSELDQINMGSIGMFFLSNKKKKSSKSVHMVGKKSTHKHKKKKKKWFRRIDNHPLFLKSVKNSFKFRFFLLRAAVLLILWEQIKYIRTL